MVAPRPQEEDEATKLVNGAKARLIALLLPAALMARIDAAVDRFASI